MKIRIPEWLVPWLVVVGAFASVWQAVELYDFATHTWHPERVAFFITTLLSTLGIISRADGIRVSSETCAKCSKAVVIMLLCFSAFPAFAERRATLIYDADKYSLLKTAPEFSSMLAPGVLLGVASHSQGWSPALEVVGSLAIIELGPGTLNAVFGGGFLSPPTGAELFGSLGVSWEIMGKSRPGMSFLATYSRDGWGMMAGVILTFE